MVRFLHTADVQLGMHAEDAKPAAERLREARFQALANAMELACAEQADFVLVAGDLFEHNLVDAVTVQRTLLLLESAAVPVYILPGNHDLLVAGSVYQRPDFERAVHVRVLREAAPLPVPGADCTLYPCPVATRNELEDLTAWIPPRAEGDGIRVGVAHGGLRDYGVPDPPYPIRLDLPEAQGLDYLALGDWHSTIVEATRRLAYSGTPEQTRFGERDSGNVLLVTLDGPGAPPRIDKRRTGTLTWEDWTEELAASDTEWPERLRRRVEALPDGARTVLRLQLGGVTAAANLPRVGELRDWLEARRQSGALVHADLRGSPRASEEVGAALERWTRQEPVLAGVVADLLRMESAGRSGEAVAGIEPRSLDELMRAWTATAPPEGLAMDEAARGALEALLVLVAEEG